MTAIATAPAYLSRWTAVGILWHRELHRGRLDLGARQTPTWAVQLLRRLAQDRHPNVRADARAALDQRRHLTREGPRWLDMDRPLADLMTDDSPWLELHIEKLQLRVSNYIYATGTPDYDVALVEAIDRFTSARPFTVADDPVEYWALLN